MPKDCTRSGKTKTSYARKQQALEHAVWSTKHSGKPIEVYKCGVCGFWHCTSMQQHQQKVEAPPSAAKLRRKLAADAAEIAAAQRRFEMAEYGLQRSERRQRNAASEQKLTTQQS